MASDVELYEKKAEDYDLMQNLRPDYVGAKSAFLELAQNYLRGKNDLVIDDFCSGTGINTRLLADRISIAKATLIDINEQFLQIAKNSEIKAQIETVASDILDADFHSGADAVISMFAYHHVPDDRKAEYISQVREALKEGSLLFLGEIYSPDKETTLEYYKYLCDSIPNKSPELERFLMQTAQSDHFEYKVAKKFADAQLQAAGFKLLESRKIWPTDPHFNDKNVGTFVEVWQL
jgi:SAM-dependent methyltransferase